ncbi:DUF3558 domain-containing protein [Streptomyces sp. NPDC006739]|uniref:DUF3558 domain-containing protein n=1 Tax=Streptomyces sp. NPDC006739 TaxID=3364763 RepID=UPI0036A7F38F
MQRADQRDDRALRDLRAKRLSRVLVAAAAVPVVLIAAGCSSDSGKGKSAGPGTETRASGGGSSVPEAGSSPSVQAAAYQKLPEPCGVLSKGTLTDLVPQGVTSGKKGSSDDTASRASCSWSSLANNGVKGSQFRWLNVSLLRFDSDAGRGAGDQQAHAYYTQQVKDAQAVSGAKNSTSEPVTGAGDEATAVRYDLKKKEGDFKQQTVVARVENVVVTLDYNGAGLAGEQTPNADDLTKAAEKAAKEVVGAVSSANGGGSATTAPSQSASKSPAASASPSGSTSPKPAAKSPSASASSKS